MRLEARAAVLSVKRTGTGLIARTLTREHGKISGLAPPPSAKHAGPQPGYLADVVWRARLSDQLGRLTWETAEPCAAFIQSPARLLALVSALALADEVSRERDPLPCMYAGLVALMRALADDDDPDALMRYPVWEARLLADTGYPLHADHCAGGGSGPAAYISPNSGAGVSEEAGAPYRRKLLPLHPAFREALLSDVPEEEYLPAVSCPEGAVNALAITEYFINKRLLDGLLDKRLPQRAAAARAITGAERREAVPA